MWPKKSKRDTPGPRIRPDRRTAALLACVLLGACGRGKESPDDPAAAPVALTVLCYDLLDYAWWDRDADGQPLEFKPDAECAALHRAVRTVSPDLLLVQGLGSPVSLARLQDALKAEGLDLPHLHYLPGLIPHQGAGILSSRPFLHAGDLEGTPFRVGSRSFTALGGTVELDDWVVCAAAVSPPTEHAYERRRNEARVVGQALGNALATQKPVLAWVGFPESLDSPMLRLVQREGFALQRPVDARGDAWTRGSADGSLYRMEHLVLLSTSAEPLLIGQEVLDSSEIRSIGPTRPQVLRFRAGTHP